MPIVAKSVMEARRKAAAEAAARGKEGDAPSLEAETSSSNTTRTIEGAPKVSAVRQRRGHAIKDENGKWQATGNYESGFARPPVETQFKEGGKGGPGRPKGSLSHDAMMEKHLKQKREVSVGGQRKKLSNRELLVIATVKAALEGKDKRARDYALAASHRLYPSREANDNAATTPLLSESDAISIAEYEHELRAQIREEILEELRRERASEGGGQ